MTGPTIAFVLYDRMTALNMIGPVEVLRFIPGARVAFVAAARGPVHTDLPALELIANAAFDEVPAPELVVVPGGPGPATVLDGLLVPWLQEVHPRHRPPAVPWLERRPRWCGGPWRSVGRTARSRVLEPPADPDQAIP